VSFGSAAVQLGAAAISAIGLAVPVTFGAPTVAVDQRVVAQGLSVPVSFGLAVCGSTTQTISAQGLAVPVGFGALSITANPGQRVPLGPRKYFPSGEVTRFVPLQFRKRL
jgi:hypothetical protein